MSDIGAGTEDDPHNSEWYRDTRLIAEKAHRLQRDRQGIPYIEHIDRVVAYLVNRWPDATKDQIQVALLHDVLEHGQIGGTELGEVASNSVLSTLRLLNRPPTPTPYLRYVQNIAGSGNVDAIRVKIADNEDDSDPCRSDLQPLHYKAARHHLEQALKDAEAEPRSPKVAAR